MSILIPIALFGLLYYEFEYSPKAQEIKEQRDREENIQTRNDIKILKKRLIEEENAAHALRLSIINKM